MWVANWVHIHSESNELKYTFLYQIKFLNVFELEIECEQKSQQDIYRCIENARTIQKNESGANQKSKTCNNGCAIAAATKNAHPIHRMQKRWRFSECMCMRV